MYKTANEEEIQLRHRIHKVFSLDSKYRNFNDRKRYLSSSIWYSRDWRADEPLSKLLHTYNIPVPNEFVIIYKGMAFVSRGTDNIGRVSIYILDENTSEKILETGAGYFGDYQSNQTDEQYCLDNFPIPFSAIDKILSELETMFNKMDEAVIKYESEENERKSKVRNNLFAKFK